MNLYILCIFVIVTMQANIFRLSTKSKQTLKLDDIIYSTLGNFRMSLTSQTCQIKIQEYRGKDYRIKGYYPYQIFKTPCNFLTLKTGTLLTQHQLIILQIKNADIKQFSQTIFTIDDLGVLRLMGLYTSYMDDSQQIPQQVWVSTFHTPNSYLYATSNIVVGSSDTLSLIINENGWAFSARNGQLRIFHIQNPARIFRYRYSGFKINPGRILDQFNHQLPSANFNGFTYLQRCGNIRFLDFKFPLLFQISAYWPQFRLLDQSGYQIISIRYPTYNCMFDFGFNVIQGKRECIEWFCPADTFLFLGKCVLKCPQPYYHQIKSNMKNRCMLNCQQGSTINQITRVCTCEGAYKIPQCPQNALSYPLGCYCKKPLYFNGITCVSQCPLTYINLFLQTNQTQITQLAGVCIKCPYKCLTCQPQNTKQLYIFLKCTQCFKGYIIFQNQCKKQCQVNLNNLQIPKYAVDYAFLAQPYYYYNQQNFDNNSISSLNSRQLIKSTIYQNKKIVCYNLCTIQSCQICSIPLVDTIQTNAKANANMNSNNKTNKNIYTGLFNNHMLKEICIQCMRPLVLFKNTCIKKCPEGYIMRTTLNFNFYCQLIIGCQYFNIKTNTQGRSQSNTNQNTSINTKTNAIINTSHNFTTNHINIHNNTTQQNKNNSQTKSVSPSLSIKQKSYNECIDCKYEINTCWTNCQKGKYFNNQSQCYCKIGGDTQTGLYKYGYGTSNCSIGNRYFNNQNIKNGTNYDNIQSYSTTKTPQNKQCPLNYFLYQVTQQCLKCPFGCLTCLHDNFGYVQCTSCSPSYFLMLDINWTHFCQRDTSLTSCQLNTESQIQKIYDAQHKICGYTISNTNNSNNNNSSTYAKTFSLIYSSITQRISCRQQDPNCLICLYQSTKICTYCSPSYYLYKKKCVQQCPENTFKYQKICVTNTKKNCRNAKIRQYNYLMNISQNSIYLQGYDYFLPTTFSRLNKVIDPVGNVFLYANLFSRDIGSRISYHPYPTLQCIKCNNNYGLDIYKKQCKRCIQKYCSQCINNIENKCYKCQDDYKLDNNTYTCVIKSQQEKDCKMGQFRNQQGICVEMCEGYWLKSVLTNNKDITNKYVNCTRYCNSNEFYKKYYKIMENENIKYNQSYLICLQIGYNRNNQISPTLTLIGKSYQVGDNVRLYNFIPLESQFMLGKQQLNDIKIGNGGKGLISFDKIKRSQTEVTNNNLENYNSYQKINDEDIIYLSIDRKGIQVLLLNSFLNATDLLILRINIKKLYGKLINHKKQEIVLSQSTNNLKQNDIQQYQNFRIIQAQPLAQSYLYLSQSQLVFTKESLKYSLSLSFTHVFVILLIILLVILNVSQQTLYKTDNFIIFLQTLPLFILSIDIRILDPSFYQFLYGFRWLIGIFGSNSKIFNNQQMWYIQNLGNYSNTALEMLICDGNIIRNCIWLWILLAMLGISYFVIGLGCMKWQILVCWKKARQDRQLQLGSQDSLINLNQLSSKKNNINHNNKNIKPSKQNQKLKITKQKNQPQQALTSPPKIARKYQQQQMYGNNTLQNEHQNKELQYRTIAKNLKINKLKSTQICTPPSTKIQVLNNSHNVVNVHNIHIIPQLHIHENQYNNKNHKYKQVQKCNKQNNTFYNTLQIFRQPYNQFYKYDPNDIDHSHKILLFLIFIFENSSLVFIYLSITTLSSTPIYPLQSNNHKTYQKLISYIYKIRIISIIISILLIIIVLAYSIRRLLHDHIGGLYMWKRIGIGIAIVYVRGGPLWMLLCVVVQLLFMIGRIWIEQLPYIAQFYRKQQQNKNYLKNELYITKTQNIQPLKKHNTHILQTHKILQNNKDQNQNQNHRKSETLSLSQSAPLQNVRQKSKKICHSDEQIHKDNKIYLFNQNDKSLNNIKNIGLNSSVAFANLNQQPIKSKLNKDNIEIIKNQKGRRRQTQKQKQILSDSGKYNKKWQKQQNQFEKSLHKSKFDFLKSKQKEKAEQQQTKIRVTFCYKIKYLLHKYKPYYRIISLITQQCIIILIYILLSFTDTFISASIQSHQQNNLINPNISLNSGLILTLLVIIFMICWYLVVFSLQFIEKLIENWYNYGLGQKDKRVKQGLLTIAKVKQYWEQQKCYQELGIFTDKVTNNNYKIQKIGRKDERQLQIEQIYFQYFNQFTYKKYEPNKFQNLRQVENLPRNHPNLNSNSQKNKNNQQILPNLHLYEHINPDHSKIKKQEQPANYLTNNIFNYNISEDLYEFIY